MSVEKHKRTKARAFIKKRIRAPRQLKVTDKIIVRQATVSKRGELPVLGDSVVTKQADSEALSGAGLTAPATGQRPKHVEKSGRSIMVLPRQTVRMTISGPDRHRFGAACHEAGFTVNVVETHFGEPAYDGARPPIDYIVAIIRPPRGLRGDALQDAYRTLLVHPAVRAFSAAEQGKPNVSGTGGGEERRRKGPRPPSYASMRREEYEQHMRKADRDEQRRVDRMWKEVESACAEASRLAHDRLSESREEWEGARLAISGALSEWHDAVAASLEGIRAARAILRSGKMPELRPMLHQALAAHEELVAAKPDPGPRPMSAVVGANRAYQIAYESVIGNAASIARAVAGRK